MYLNETRMTILWRYFNLELAKVSKGVKRCDIPAFYNDAMGDSMFTIDDATNIKSIIKWCNEKKHIEELIKKIDHLNNFIETNLYGVDTNYSPMCELNNLCP